MPPTGWNSPPCILVVDDQPVNVKLVERVLASADYYNVVSTSDPSRAISLAELTKPDLVLLDLHMPGFPGFDGFDVLKALQNLTGVEEFVPVLVLTGDLNTDTRRKALSVGATDFLTKPFDIHELVLRIGNLLHTRLLHLWLQGEKNRIEEALERRERELAEAQVEMLERLAAAVELRDHQTGRHIRRVAELSADLAIALGLESHVVETIRRAAPLHDLGKIGTPDGTLLKCAGLSPDEEHIMRTHTVIGAGILLGGTSSLLRTAAEIARHHHERWDGCGYPDGLTGESIPLSARIVAVVDVYDALTHERPYRSAWSEEKTVKMIISGSGTHFDPKVVEAFLSLESIRPFESSSRR